MKTMNPYLPIRKVPLDFQGIKSSAYSVQMEKKKGSITFFPAFTSHRVKPVTKGKRYVLQELFIGDHFA